jgi:hypothetical protein
MKKCTKCSIEKPLIDFYSHPKTQDGKQSSCKQCCIKTQTPYTANHYKNNPESYKGNSEKAKQWKLNNPKYTQKYQKNRKQNDPLFKLNYSIRSMTSNAFKRACQNKYKKGKKTEHILGCTMEQFILHLQSQFKPGMCLENYGQGIGKWNIDHITPISSAQTEKEIYKLSHYTNLQPLWWEENMAKGSKGIGLAKEISYIKV